MMAEGGQTEKESSHFLVTGSEDGDLTRSLQTGHEYVYEFYCEPCDGEDIHVEATFYCRSCKEYMCKKCSTSHKRFKQSQDHNIQDVRSLSHKPPVSKRKPASTRAFTSASHVRDIDTPDNIKSCVSMSPNMLLVADWRNDRLILLDTGSGRQISELKLSGEPWQVTRISDTEAAVTLPGDNKIVLLRTQPQLSMVREISVWGLSRGECHGIVYMDNRFVVTFREDRVDIIDMSGKVLRTISSKTGQSGKRIFINPVNVAVNPVTGSVYVTDWVEHRTHRLVKLSMEGSVLATYMYNNDENDNLCEVALDSQGMVYVGGRTTRLFGLVDSCGVHQLNADLVKVRTIIYDLASLPLTLSIDEASKQLFVGLDGGVVKVYSLNSMYSLFAYVYP